MMELTAQEFGYEEDESDEVFEAGFSGVLGGSEFVLLIQRSEFDPDEQDTSLGMDTYCLASGGRTNYGGVTKATRDGHFLYLEMSPEAAAVLEIPASLRVRLEESVGNVNEFFEGLAGILEWGRTEERPALAGF